MTLDDLLKSVRVTPSSYASSARAIEAGGFDQLRPVNVAVLSTFTAEPIHPYVVVESARRGLLARPSFGPLNQIEQEVFDASSRLYAFAPDVVVIATRLEEVAPQLIYSFAHRSRADVETELDAIEMRFARVLEELRRRTSAPVLLFNFAGPAALAYGLADPVMEVSQASAIHAANERLGAVSRKAAGAYVFDYARMVHEYGLMRWTDPKLLYLGRIPFGADAQLETGRRLSRYLRAVLFAPCKCLVLDLDNTLWGGVLGEDGINGIRIGDDYPGNVFKEFQRRLAALRARGILLAVASKNNEVEVLEVFENHRDLLLRRKDFAAMQIHWGDKATSLQRIAEELNIGTDALAFFDDSPVERDWIRSQMPEVTVVDVPSSPLDYGRALEESGAFDHLFVSREDRDRAEMYSKEQERTRLKGRSVSVEEFLAELEMRATVGFVGPPTLPRVEQLLAKTNQFNLTSRRHSASKVQAMINAGCIAVWLRLEDRFGDNGLVAAAMARPEEAGQWWIDSFVMSCRVIGRQVETALLSVLAQTVRQRGAEVLVGEYAATPKSQPAADFYSKCGFESLDPDGRLWRWTFTRGDIAPPARLTINWDHASGR